MNANIPLISKRCFPTSLPQSKGTACGRTTSCVVFYPSHSDESSRDLFIPLFHMQLFLQTPVGVLGMDHRVVSYSTSHNQTLMVTTDADSQRPTWQSSCDWLSAELSYTANRCATLRTGAVLWKWPDLLRLEHTCLLMCTVCSFNTSPLI